MLAEQQLQSDTRRTRLRKVPWSFVVAGVAIAGAVLYLVLANTSASAEYYLTIHELRVCTTCASRAVRVAGIVAANSVVRDDKTQQVRFAINDQSETMSVEYGGGGPDIFRPGIQVVVGGGPVHRVFQGQNLLGKGPPQVQAGTPPPGDSR